jgi:predicted O-methyltransferase YrrM
VSRHPPALAEIERETASLGFRMGSDARTGSLLRTLAASKPGGRLLELGTGTGLATAWLLDGMDASSTLVSVDVDPAVVDVARRHLGRDPRVRFVVSDGGAHLDELAAEGARFDLVFADAWPGKYDHLERALGLAAPGGFYVVDDMLPQPSWPPDHAPRAEALARHLAERPDLAVAALDWSTGLILAVKNA